MLIKVCGIRESEDLISVSKLGVDYVGLIFVPGSPRCASGSIDPMLTELLSRSVPALKKVGVFLDAEMEEILDTIERYHLDAVQLHGSEPPATCALLSQSVEVIKAFSIGEEFDFSITADYEGVCNFFLFDTAGPFAGGNGYAFDWSLLGEYNGETLFLLSGGIGPADTVKVLEIVHPQFAGIDVNSKFELYPGKKDISRLTTFVRAFKPISYGL